MTIIRRFFLISSFFLTSQIVYSGQNVTVDNTIQNPVNVSGITSLPTTTSFSGSSINFNSTGDNTIVGGVSSQTVRVYRIFFVVSSATNITIKDGSTALTGAMNMTANGTFTLDYEIDPWFVTSSGNGFVINQSGTAQISGRVYYSQS